MSMPKIIISANEVVLSDVKVPYKFIKEKYPDKLECLKDIYPDNSLQSLLYEAGGTKNHVIYKDGTKKELPTDCINLHRFWTDRYIFKFDYSEYVFKKKEEKKIVKKYAVFFSDILEAPIQTRGALERTFCNERNGRSAPTPEEYMEQVAILAKGRLDLSDWTQVADVQAGMSDEKKDFWLNYRKTLREAMASTDPFNEVVLPVIPPNSTRNG